MVQVGCQKGSLACSLELGKFLQAPIELVIAESKAIEPDDGHAIGKQAAVVAIGLQGALEHIPGIDDDGVAVRQTLDLPCDLGEKVDGAVEIVDGKELDLTRGLLSAGAFWRVLGASGIRAVATDGAQGSANVRNWRGRAGALIGMLGARVVLTTAADRAQSSASIGRGRGDIRTGALGRVGEAVGVGAAIAHGANACAGLQLARRKAACKQSNEQNGNG